MIRTPAVAHPVRVMPLIQEDLGVMTQDPSSVRTHRPQYAEDFGRNYFEQHHRETEWSWGGIEFRGLALINQTSWPSFQQTSLSRIPKEEGFANSTETKVFFL